MTDKQELEFVAFLDEVQELCLHAKPLSNEQKKLYFETLKDLPFDEIRRNIVLHFRTKGNTFFPSIADLRGPANDLKLQGQHAWDRVNYYLDRYYFPGFACSLDIVKQKMEANDEAFLYSHFIQWGARILNSTAPEATQKYFIDSFQTARKVDHINQLDGCTPLKELVGGMVKELSAKNNGNE